MLASTVGQVTQSNPRVADERRVEGLCLPFLTRWLIASHVPAIGLFGLLPFFQNQVLCLPRISLLRDDY